MRNSFAPYAYCSGKQHFTYFCFTTFCTLSRILFSRNKFNIWSLEATEKLDKRVQLLVYN